jgi:hypothetical protein
MVVAMEIADMKAMMEDQMEIQIPMVMAELAVAPVEGGGDGPGKGPGKGPGNGGYGFSLAGEQLFLLPHYQKIRKKKVK